MKIIGILVLLMNLICCTTNSKKNVIDRVDTTATISKKDDEPKVDVKITLIDSVLNFGDSVLLDICLLNNGSEVQELLFDKPYGPWATSAKVIDLRTKMSALKYESQSLLSSKVYTNEDLKGKYYYLKPGQTILRKYSLSDVVVYKSTNNELPKGTYQVQLFYYSNPSNILKLTIR